MASCLEKEYKPMVPIKTLDIIFRRRYVKNTQFYFTNRKHAVKDDEDKNVVHRSFFSVPATDKLLSYIKFSDKKEKHMARTRLAQPLYLKDNLRIAATRDMSERLFIEEVPDNIRTVIAIHPEFYTVIEGRPLRCFDDIKVYINNIRQYAMSRQQIGYRRDIILNISKDIVEEIGEYEKISKEVKQHIKDFQQFLTEDYDRACNLVAKAEKTYSDLVAKNLEFLSYVSSITILNNMIFKLDAVRNVLKIYRSFLLHVAPLSWREQYDESLTARVIKFGSFTTDNDLVETLDIDKTVELAKIELQDPYPPHMYFNNPEQMMYMFRTMELQSREYLIQLSHTYAPFKSIQDCVKQLKLATKQEMDYFQDYIDNINKEIERESFNESYLQEKFFRIINETFFDSIASPSSLKLKICIEYVFEQVFGKCEEGHQSLYEPMRTLEVYFENYNLMLDALDFKTVNHARNDCFAQDLKVMRNAYNAQRELRAFAEMTKAINKAFLPPAKYTRPVMQKFMSKDEKIAVVRAERKSKLLASGMRVSTKPFKIKLTAEQRTNLLLFTNWCDGSDPAPYLDEYSEYIEPVLQKIVP